MVGLAVGLPSIAAGPPRVVLLASALLTAAWQGPLRGGWLSGYDIQHEYAVATTAIRLGRFPIPLGGDPYKGMLSLTVWPAQVHALTGLNLRTILAFPPSIFLALCLVVVWATLRERLSARASAVLCALLVLGSEPLVRELPGVTRECYALFFFAILVMAVTSTRLRVSSAKRSWSPRVSVSRSRTTAPPTRRRRRRGRVPADLCLPHATSRAGPHCDGRRVGRRMVGSSGACSSRAPGAISTNSSRRYVRTASVFCLAPGMSSPGGCTAPPSASSSTRRSSGKRPRSASHLPRLDEGLSSRHTRAARELQGTSATGLPVVGSLLALATALLAELLLVVAFASVLTASGSVGRIASSRESPEWPSSALSLQLSREASQTIAVDFGPTRVQAQMYLLLVISVGVALQSLLSSSSVLAG